MSKRSFGSPSASRSIKFNMGSPAAPAEAVFIEVDPPNPIAELIVPHGTTRAAELREVAKSCKTDKNWGVWQFDHVEKCWTTIHKESKPTAPRLNADPVYAIETTLAAFSKSIACSQIVVRNSAGAELDMELIKEAEWTPVDDLAVPEEPDAVDLLEQRVTSMDSEIAALKSTVQDQALAFHKALEDQKQAFQAHAADKKAHK